MRTLLALIFSATISLQAAHGATLADVTYPDEGKIGDQKAELNGLALRKKAIFKVYVGALYLTKKESDAAKILASDSARRMQMHFLRGVGKEKICDAWKEGLDDNTPNASAELKAKFKSLCDAMEDMEDGEELVLTYHPGKGTAVAAKGKVKATIEGKEFADALLRCWIGPKPGPGEDFKNGVLGVKAD